MVPDVDPQKKPGSWFTLSHQPLTSAWLTTPAGLIQPQHGGTCSFLGTVRNEHLGKQVTGIDYECFPELAASVFQTILDEVSSQWGPTTHVAAAHAAGRHAIGDLVVAIHVAAAHREAAFAACRHVIERIKQDLPVWKHEHYADSASAWLPGS
jgi:molybdopterin synthase catalytic subunit